MSNQREMDPCDYLDHDCIFCMCVFRNSALAQSHLTYQKFGAVSFRVLNEAIVSGRVGPLIELVRLVVLVS
jgi:hypothetical protein